MSELVECCIDGVDYWLDEKSKILYKTVDDDDVVESVSFLPPITNGQEARNERLLEIVGRRMAIDEIQELIAAGADVNALELPKPMHKQTGPKPTVISKITAKAPTVNPYPPLWRAVMACNIEVIHILLAAGADTNIKIKGKTLLQQMMTRYGSECCNINTGSIGDTIIAILTKYKKDMEDSFAAMPPNNC